MPLIAIDETGKPFRGDLQVAGAQIFGREIVNPWNALSFSAECSELPIEGLRQILAYLL